MQAIWEVATTLNATIHDVLDAVNTTGLKGRLVNGARVWNPKEIALLRAHLRSTELMAAGATWEKREDSFGCAISRNDCQFEGLNG